MVYKICTVRPEASYLQSFTDQHYMMSVAGLGLTECPLGGTAVAVEKAVLDYDYIRFTTVDMNGVARGQIVPVRKAVKCIQSGIACFCGLVSYGPNNEIILPQKVVDFHFGNVLQLPDLSTLKPIPWLGEGKYKLGQFLCETFWDEKTPQEACTRNIARRLLDKLDNMGLRIMSGMEMEFICLEKESGKPVFSGNDWQTMLTQSEFTSWFIEVEQNLRKMGVNIDSMHTEYGPGQFEFATSPQFGIQSADSSMLFKLGVKEMAVQRGWQANFMAKILPDVSGSGGHFSFSLWDKDGMNVFHNSDDADGLSEMARYWIGGTLKHARALTALCCITTNCYQRLHGPWCPSQAMWGIQNRTAMLRVKNNGPSGTYIENRLPSALFNPYLVLAGSLAAGMDGIENKIACPKMHDVDGAEFLPRSLLEALKCLQEDEVMVNAMGKTFVDWFVQNKIEADLKAIEGITDKTELLRIENKQYARLM